MEPVGFYCDKRESLMCGIAGIVFREPSERRGSSGLQRLKLASVRPRTEENRRRFSADDEQIWKMEW